LIPAPKWPAASPKAQRAFFRGNDIALKEFHSRTVPDWYLGSSPINAVRPLYAPSEPLCEAYPGVLQPSTSWHTEAAP